MDSETLSAMVMLLAITLIIFLVCRELVCWYWKMNRTVALLEDIRDLLKKSSSAVTPEPVMSRDVIENEDGTFSIMGKTFTERRDAEAAKELFGV